MSGSVKFIDALTGAETPGPSTHRPTTEIRSSGPGWRWHDVDGWEWTTSTGPKGPVWYRVNGSARPGGEALVGHNDAGMIVVDFQTTGPWQWVEFTPAQAIAFAATVTARARQVIDSRQEVSR